MMLPADQPPSEMDSRRADLAADLSFRPGGVLLCGYLRKLKRMKKKYFILFGEADKIPARLEYFDSEKKWRNGQTPKRSIPIKACFNINKRSDCKHKYVVALYTNEDCFPIAFDTEDELSKWYITLLKIQLSDQVAEGEELKPRYEHVWQVTVRSKELGSRKNMAGPHRLCLTSRVLTLFRMPLTSPPEMWEFPVNTIRRCGHSNSHFFMEMGRGTVTGAGELWMELEEAAAAQSMHATIIEAMRNSAKEDLPPRQRTRSSSTNEQNRPVLQQSWSQASPASASSMLPPGAPMGLRNRADSVPSRSRTTSEVVVTPPDGRPASVYLQEASSPPVMASPSNMQSESVTSSSYSMDDFDAVQPLPSGSSYRGSSRFSRTATPENSLPKDATILEEGGPPDYLLMNYGGGQQADGLPAGSDYLSMTPQQGGGGGFYSSSPSIQPVPMRAPLSTSRTVGVKTGPRSSVVGPPPIKPPLHQNPYMEMSSPVASVSSWSSPPNVPDGYMPMYPSSSGPGSVGNRSGTHTRSSSFCEDVTDGSYVPMAPQSVASNSSTTSREDDVTSSSYMDMQPVPVSLARRSMPRDVQQHHRGRMSPASCSSLASSFTSGTPPVGSARFQEYHLEKVASLLTPSEDDADSVSSLKCRQSRAYSVGSRPDLRLRKMAVMEHGSPLAAPHPPPSTTNSALSSAASAALHYQGLADARVRAYSVGSRGGAGMGSGQLANTPNRNSSTSVHSSRNEMEPSAGIQSSASMATAGQQEDSQRKKSLSVPVLGGAGTPGGPSHSGGSGNPNSNAYAPNNRTGTFLRTLLAHQSAARKGTDLMEMEFNKEMMGLVGGGGGVDVVDSGTPSSSYAATYGSSESVGHGSVTSTGSTGGGRSRSASSSRPSITAGIRSGINKTKDSFRTRPGKLERLESVPQGRDQDYIEYGQQQQQQQLQRFHQASSLGSPEMNSPRILGDQDSADEYVELARPAGNGTRSRDSMSRLSIPASGDGQNPGSSVPSPQPGEYLAMDYGKSIPARNSGGHSGYMDMSYPNKPNQPLSQPASVSDNEGYLPMDFTPRSSRNPSRQSSQADLTMALGAFSPPLRGSQTPSHSGSARHSRTEESLLPTEDQNYMEMTFAESASSHSLRSTDRSPSIRTRGPSPYDMATSSGALTDSEAGTGAQTPTKSSSGKATTFLSNLLGRKSSSSSSKGQQASATAGSPSTAEAVGGTLPRSSRSMPPSPFSSLKRTKSNKKRRAAAASPPTASVAQSLSPVSPDVEGHAPSFHQGRSQSFRSHSLHSPLTPPSPSADFMASRMHPMHFSPPPTANAAPSVAAAATTFSPTCKPSSQPISIASQRPSAYATRGSPVINLSLNVRSYDQDVGGGYGPHHRAFSSSPGRATVAMMPTLSPLPEVLLSTSRSNATENVGYNPRRSASLTTGPTDSGYMNMNFPSAPPAAKFVFDPPPRGADAPPTTAPSIASQPLSIPLKGGPVMVTAAATEDKENDEAIILPPAKEAATTADSSVAVPSANGQAPSILPAPSKQRANSLEKIVGALDKVKIGPKRHSSGDKPLKRSGVNLISRSNSYQPSSGSRVVVAGNKPASLFPLLNNIPAGMVVHSTSTDEVGGSAKSSKSPPGPATMGPQRTSSSSLASLGEDLLAGELQAVHWQASNAHSSSPAPISSASPSPSVLSRPVSAQSERELNYAQLDLAPALPRGDVVEESSDNPPRSPRHPRPCVEVPAAANACNYAQIDFKKSEGLVKTVPSTAQP